jgi:hypothetical protein
VDHDHVNDKHAIRSTLVTTKHKSANFVQRRKFVLICCHA